MIDLDGFKAVNDEFGHQTGDEVLIQLGHRLIATARDEDTVARLGGDEFVVLYDQLPNDGGDDVIASLQDRLTDALAERYLVRRNSLAVSASVGFVRSHVDELGYELLGRADQAMYKQKEERRAKQ